MQRPTAKQITAILKRGEGETAEFKKVFDRETVETLGAFANTRGGQVIIGVSDEGRVLGVEVGKETVQNWINQVKLSSANALIPDVDLLTIKKEDHCGSHDAGTPHQARGLPGKVFQTGSQRQSFDDHFGSGQYASANIQ